MDRLEVLPKSKVLPAHEAFNFDVKVKVTKPFSRRGREMQPLKDYIYIKSNYFDMKVPVQIFPSENNESAVQRLSSSLVLGSRVLKTSIKDVGLSAYKKPDLQLKEQSLIEIEPKEETKKILKVEMLQADLSMSTDDRVNPSDSETLIQIKEILKEKHPSLEKLMDISLKQEREKHERQNEKVLQILKIKDDLINNLQRKLIQSETKLHNMNTDKEEVENELRKSNKEDIERKLNIKLLDELSEETSSKIISIQDEDQDLEERIIKLTSENRNEKFINETLRNQLTELQGRIQELSRRESEVLSSVKQEEIKHNQSNSMKANELIQSLDVGKNESTRSLQTEINRAKELELELKKLNKTNYQLREENIKVKESYKNNILELYQLINQPMFITNDSCTNEQLQNQANNCIITLREQFNELQVRIRELENKTKALDEIIISHQTEKNELVMRYNEEISELRNAVIELENKDQIDQPEITDVTVSNLRERIAYYEQQQKERENYITQLEANLKTHNNLLIRDEPLVSKLKLRILSLENEVRNLQAKEGEELPVNIVEKIDTLEFSLIQLREEYGELKVENARMQQSFNSVINDRESKIKALERVLGSSNKDEVIYENINIEEANKLLRHNINELEERCDLLQRENIRLKQIERLSEVLPSDKEMILKLTNKCKIQKNNIEYLKGLLIRAKLEFDKLHSQQECSEENRADGNIKLVNKCEEYRMKLHDTFNTIIKLKEEFIQKLMEQEECNRKYLSNLFTTNRNEIVKNVNLSHQLSKTIEELKLEKTRTEEATNNKDKIEIMMSKQIEELENKLTKHEISYKELCNINKNNESIIKQESIKNATLKNTIDTLKSINKDDQIQRYLNVNEELYTVNIMNAKLQNNIKNLESQLMEQNNNHILMKDNDKLLQEKKSLSNELEKTKGIIKLNIEQIQQLEHKLQDTNTNLNNESIRNKTLCNQLTIVRHQLRMIKLQQYEPKYYMSYTPKFPTTEPNKFTMNLMQLVSELNNTEETKIIAQRLNEIIRQDIFELQDSTTQLRTEDIQINDKIYDRCLKLEKENTNLGLLLESLLTSKEEIELEGMIRTQRELKESRESVNKTNSKLIELARENCQLKADIRETQDHLEAKSKEYCFIKAKLEKELTLAKINAEEELSLKLSIRNDQVITYFDNHISKLFVNKDDTNALMLGREVCAQKLMIEKLLLKLDESDKEKCVLESRVAELAVALQKESEQLVELHAEDYVKQKKKANMYREIFNNKELLNEDINWSKKLLKLKSDMKAAEVSDLNFMIEKFKIENTKLNHQLDNRNICETHYGIRKEFIEELTRKNGEAKRVIEEKNRTIGKLRQEVRDIVSRHLVEIKRIQEKEDTNRELERKRALHDYDLYAQKYEVGGTHKSHYILLRQTIEQLNTDLIKSKQKLKDAEEDVNHYKNEAETYKKALISTQIIFNTEENTVLTPSPLKTKQSRSTSSIGKKRSTEHLRSPSIVNEKIHKKELLRNNEEFLRMPKLVKELLKSKRNEVAVKIEIKKLAQGQLEMQKEITRLNTNSKDLEGRLRHYERLLIENKIKFDNQFIENEYIEQLEMKVIELETICERYRVKELMLLVNSLDDNNMDMDSIDEVSSNMLINGIITLCNKLANIEYNVKGESGNELERLQRIVIRSLTELIKSLQGDLTCNLQLLIPCDESKRQAWYLELFELGMQRTEKIAAKFGEWKVQCNLINKQELSKQIIKLEDETKRLTQILNLIIRDISLNTIYQRPLMNDSRSIGLISEFSNAKEPITELIELKNENKELQNKLKELMDYKTKLETALEISKKESKQNINEFLIHEKLFNELKEQSRMLTDENKELKKKCMFLIQKLDSSENEQRMLHGGSQANSLIVNNDCDNEDNPENYRSGLKLTAELKDLNCKFYIMKLDLQRTPSEPRITQQYHETIIDSTHNKPIIDTDRIKYETKDKMIAVIQQLDHELKQQSQYFNSQQTRYEAEIKSKSEIIKSKEANLQTLNNKYRVLEMNMKKFIEESNVAKYELSQVNKNSNEMNKSRKTIETLSHEQEVVKLKQSLLDREEAHKKFIHELQEEHRNERDSSRELVRVYELQLKLLKEKFKVEYLELNNKLTVSKQTKGSISPKRVKEHELSVELMYQLSQRDAQIKILETNLRKAKTNLREVKNKIPKQTQQFKEDTEIRYKSKGRSTSQKRKHTTGSIENNSLVMNSSINLKEYNDMMQTKANIELKYENSKNSLKTLECQLSMEREKTEDALRKMAEVKSELENLRESLKSSKKEQNELIKTHKNTHQKVLNELTQVKSNWKSPEEFRKLQDELRDTETQVKELKEDLNRKNELMKQWKDKIDLKQSETGQMLNEVEIIKDSNEKYKKMIKELERKDQAIRSLKNGMEATKVSEKQLSEENKVLIEKLRMLKAEVGRKDTTLRAFKEKSIEAKTQEVRIECSKDNEEEIGKLKAKIAYIRQDVDRKDDQIRSLTAKINALMSEGRGEVFQVKELGSERKELDDVEQRLCLAEGKSQNLSIILRTMFRELLIDIEKFRMRINANRMGRENVDKSEDIGNADLVELMERLARIVENREDQGDYEKLVESYKVLIKERHELEKILNELESANEYKA